MYASRLRRTEHPPVAKTCRNVRLKHVMENIAALGRTLVPASAAKTGVVLQVVPPSLLNAEAAPTSLLHGSLFLCSAGRSSSRGSSPISISVGGADGGGRAFQYPDILLDSPCRPQIGWVGYAVGYDGRFQRNGQLPLMQRLRDPGVNVCKNIDLDGAAREERPCFGARLSMSWSTGSLDRPITWRLFPCFGVYIPRHIGRGLSP